MVFRSKRNAFRFEIGNIHMANSLVNPNIQTENSMFRKKPDRVSFHDFSSSFSGNGNQIKESITTYSTSESRFGNSFKNVYKSFFVVSRHFYARKRQNRKRVRFSACTASFISRKKLTNEAARLHFTAESAALHSKAVRLFFTSSPARKPCLLSRSLRSLVKFARSASKDYIPRFF